MRNKNTRTCIKKTISTMFMGGLGVIVISLLFIPSDIYAQQYYLKKEKPYQKSDKNDLAPYPYKMPDIDKIIGHCTKRELEMLKLINGGFEAIDDFDQKNPKKTKQMQNFLLKKKNVKMVMKLKSKCQKHLK